MYLHIGNKRSVRRDRVIGIFDLDTATVSKISKDFISGYEKRGKLLYDDFDLPRSFILTDERGEYLVRLSRISTSSLKARAEGSEE